MQVVLDVPDDIARKLDGERVNLSRHALKALAVQAYRSDLLTAFDVQRMLGLATREEADELLKSTGSLPGYPDEALHRNLERLRRLTQI